MTKTIAPLTPSKPAINFRRAAVIIDSASCITILLQKYKQPGVPNAEQMFRYRLCLIVRRNHEQELRYLIDALGVDGKISPIHARVKERGTLTARAVKHYEIVWSGETAIAILEHVMPFLDERKQEAKLAIKFWREGGYVDETGKARRGPVPENFWPVRVMLYEQMRELKASLESRTRVVSESRKLAGVPDSRNAGLKQS